MPKTPDMTQDEMVEILKGIIRDGTNAAARIAAIKELRSIQGGKQALATGFEELDGPRRGRSRLKAA